MAVVVLGLKLMVGESVGDEGERVGNKFNVGVGAIVVVGALVGAASTRAPRYRTLAILGFAFTVRVTPSSIAARVLLTWLESSSVS